MVLSAIMNQLEEWCPKSFAEDWDNAGLQTGVSTQDIRSVYLALDCTSEVIEDAKRCGADLILTHHPLLFHGIKQVTDADYVGKRIVTLLQNHMAVYSMHTNFDVMSMADAAADRLRLLNSDVLHVTYEDSISHEGLGRIGELPEHMTLHDTAVYVRDVFEIPHVRFYGDPDTPVVMTAILPGSGHDEIDAAIRKGADVLITGVISHHNGLDAIEKGIAVIDAGHYGIEKLFVPYMKDYLAREMPSLAVYTAKVKEPFTEV